MSEKNPVCHVGGITIYSDNEMIDSLRAENAKLREALEKVTEFSGDPFKTGLWTFQGEIDAMKKISQEALKNE